MIFDFVTNKIFAKLLAGKIAAGDSKKLGGKGASEYALNSRVDWIQTFSTGTLSAGWWRIAKYDRTNGSFANISDIILQRINSAESAICEIRFDMTDSNYSFKALDVQGKSVRWGKIRLTMDTANNCSYIEVYVTASSPITTVTIKTTNVHANYKYWEAITPVLTEEAVDGVTIATTYDIPKNIKPMTDYLDVLNTSVLTATMALPVQTVKFYKLGGGNYTGGDLPADYYKYSDAVCFKHDSNTATVILTGYGSTVKKLAINYYVGSAWVGWDTNATTKDLANYMPISNGTAKADGATSTPFFVQSTNEGNNAKLALIGFKDADGVGLGRIGFDGADNPIMYDTSAHRKKLIHEGNVADFAATVESGLFDLEFVESSSSGAGSVFTIENCYYHKVGSHVFISGSKQNITGAKTFNAGIKGTGLPFTPAVNGGTGEMVRVVACSADKPVAAAIKEGTDITYNLQTGGIVASGTLEQGKTLAVYGLYMTNA